MEVDGDLPAPTKTKRAKGTMGLGELANQEDSQTIDAGLPIQPCKDQ
jgi:hypothetical protein